MEVPSSQLTRRGRKACGFDLADPRLLYIDGERTTTGQRLRICTCGSLRLKLEDDKSKQKQMVAAQPIDDD
jgi:hypothetical protein